MAQTLSADAYARALKSDDVTILVGNGQEQLSIKKAFLALHSTAFAEELSTKIKVENEAGDGTDKSHYSIDGQLHIDHSVIDLRNVGAQAVKVFARWAFSEHLQRLAPNASLAERLDAKLILIDLWIFCDMYGISKLQNEAMAVLCEVVKKPNLVTKEDVHFIFTRTSSSHALRHFALMALVAQLEPEDGKPTSTIADYTDINAEYPEMMAMAYDKLKAWTWYQPDEKMKTSGWIQWLQLGKMQRLLNVPVQPPPEWVLTFCGVIVPKPFEPGEVIELD